MEEEQRKEGRRGGDRREGRNEARRDGLRDMDFLSAFAYLPITWARKFPIFPGLLTLDSTLPIKFLRTWLEFPTWISSKASSFTIPLISSQTPPGEVPPSPSFSY